MAIPCKIEAGVCPTARGDVSKCNNCWFKKYSSDDCVFDELVALREVPKTPKDLEDPNDGNSRNADARDTT